MGKHKEPQVVEAPAVDINQVNNPNRGTLVMNTIEEIKPTLIVKQGTIDELNAREEARHLGERLLKRGESDADDIGSTLEKIILALPKPVASATYTTTQRWATIMKEELRKSLAQQTVANIISRCVRALNAKPKRLTYTEQYKLDNKAQVESRKRRSQAELKAEQEAKEKAAKEKEERLEQAIAKLKEGNLPSETGHEDAISRLSISRDIAEDGKNDRVADSDITDSFLFITGILEQADKAYYALVIQAIEGFIPTITALLKEIKEAEEANKA